MRTKARFITVAAIAAACTAVVLPGSALASPGDSGCSGDSCMANDGTSGNIHIQAWAYNTTFYGHFQLLVPSGRDQNSPTKTYTAGDVGGGASFTVPGASAGAYCAIAWATDSNGNLYNAGEPCLNI